MQPAEMDEMLAYEDIKYLVDSFDERARYSPNQQMVEYENMSLGDFTTTLSEEDGHFGLGGAAEFPGKVPRSGLHFDEQHQTGRANISPRTSPSSQSSLEHPVSDAR